MSAESAEMPGLLRRLVYDRDWGNLAREHARGLLQTGGLIWLVATVIDRGLGWVRDREALSDTPDFGFLDSIATADRWLLRVSTGALVAAVLGALAMLALIYAASRTPDPPPQ